MKKVGEAYLGRLPGLRPDFQDAWRARYPDPIIAANDAYSDYTNGGGEERPIRLSVPKAQAWEFRSHVETLSRVWQARTVEVVIRAVKEAADRESPNRVGELSRTIAESVEQQSE